MNLTKALLSVLPAASKDETRAHLNVVHLERTPEDVPMAVATNGHWLLAATDKAAGAPVEGSLMRTDAEKIGKMLGSQQNAAALTLANGTFSAELPDGVNLVAQAADLEFPNWRALVAEDAPVIRIGLDAVYLEAICKAYRAYAKAQGAKSAHITLELRSADLPVSLSLETDGGGLYGMLMPVRI